MAETDAGKSTQATTEAGEEESAEETSEEESSNSDDYYSEDFKELTEHEMENEIRNLMTDPSEHEIWEQKLEILKTKLSKPVKEKDDEPYSDPDKLLQLKTLRLQGLDLGPTVECLELFENLESLYLDMNKLQFLTINSFQFNVKLLNLNLSRNKIMKVHGSIKHLE